MGGIEISGSNNVCRRCGAAHGRNKGNFLVSYAEMHKGVGYMPFCKDCVDEIYNNYLSMDGVTPADAVRQVCRKLDLYWNPAIFSLVERTNTTRSMMTSYVAKINTIKYAGKCYDDTLKEEGAMWVWPNKHQESPIWSSHETDSHESEDDIEIPEDIILFWGPGYTAGMYMELEQRRKYWMSRYPAGTNIDIGEEAIIRQICNLEIAINHDRAAGKPIDKNVNTLNTLLGSANLKPTQRANEGGEDVDGTPFGVWIRRWENSRPVPDPDPAFEDVDGIIRYITVWFLGHLCKMLGIRNTYCRLYEEEIARLRVNAPQYDDEDDEDLFNDIFGTSGSQQDGGDAS